MARGLFMGTPVSLAMFAALVAAVTVVAAMTVVGGLALLYYSAAEPPEPAEDVTHLHLSRDPRIPDLLPAVAPVMSQAGAGAMVEGHPTELNTPLRPERHAERYPADGATRIDTPRIDRLMPAFEEEESSLNRDLAPFPQPNRAGWAEPGWEHATGARRAVGGPSRFGRAQAGNAAFGTPEWTEEEGATEIFSAHNLGDMSEFAFVDEEVPATRR